jgi:uncharacterized protein (DUF885 family)
MTGDTASAQQLIPRPRTQSPRESRFYEIAERYIDGTLGLNPTSATYYGYHKYDGDLEDFSPSGLARRLEFYRACSRDLSALSRGELSAPAAIDYDLVRNDIEGNLFALEEMKSHESDPSLYNDILGYAWLFLTMLEDGNPAWPQRLASLISRMKAMPGFLEDAKENLKNPSKVLTEFIAQQNAGNIEFFREALPRLSRHAPELRSELDEVNGKVLAALEDYQRFLENDLMSRATGDWRLGSELWTRKLRYTLQSDMTPDQIVERAWEQVHSERAEMLKLAQPLHAQLFPGHKHDQSGDELINTVVSEVIGELSKRHSRPEMLLNDVRDRWVPKVVEFIRQSDFLTLPPENDNFVIEKTPGFLDGRAVAFFNPPPAFEPHLKKSYWISSIPTTGDPVADKARTDSFLREYNDYGLQSLTLHEAFPGHYVQFYYALNSPYASIYKKMFANSTLAEGWAVLSERLMFEVGYAKDEPECYLMHKKMNLRSPLNAILDARLHTGRGSEAEDDKWALELMEKFGFQENAEAVGKLRRAKVTSTQLSTYFVGYLELRDILADYRSKKGAAFSFKEFNEEFLSYGTVPPRAIRELMFSDRRSG